MIHWPRFSRNHFFLIAVVILFFGFLFFLFRQTHPPVAKKFKIEDIARGDIISYERSNRAYKGKVLALPGEAALYKWQFYLRSQSQLFKVEEKNLPPFRFVLSDDNLKNNTQKWFEVAPNQVYVVRDAYPMQPEWAGDTKSQMTTVRTLNPEAGLVNVSEITAIKKQPLAEAFVLNEYKEKEKQIDKDPKIDLLYPPEKVAVKRLTATIKLNVVAESFIDSQFSSEDPSERSGGQENESDLAHYIYFEPSPSKHLEVLLNGVLLPSGGISTHPYLRCAENVDTLSWTGTDYYYSESECLQKTQAEVLIFANLNLRPGKNELEIIRTDTNTSLKKEIVFDPNYTEELGNPTISAATPYEQRFAQDHNCITLSLAPVLSVPLVKSGDTNFYYKLSFPQTFPERGDTKKRLVVLKINHQMYQVVLPSVTRFNQVIASTGDLELPEKYLAFQDRKLAKPARMLTTDNLPFADFSYPGIYFELIPVDRTGKVYPDFILPWGTVNSSSCDG